jgi:predicted  nucleic acid-binding Zn-ribbon protein
LFQLKQSFPERLSNIKNQHDKILESLKDLRKRQKGLSGRVEFLELAIDCLERIMTELEEDSGFPALSQHQACGNGNLQQRVNELQSRVSKLINRVERVEPHILSSTLPRDQSTPLESQG